jgi:hypothetical protein
VSVSKFVLKSVLLLAKVAALLGGRRSSCSLDPDGDFSACAASLGRCCLGLVGAVSSRSCRAGDARGARSGPRGGLATPRGRPRRGPRRRAGDLLPGTWRRSRTNSTNRGWSPRSATSRHRRPASRERPGARSHGGTQESNSRNGGNGDHRHRGALRTAALEEPQKHRRRAGERGAPLGGGDLA